MIDVTDVLKLLASGRALPQSRLPRVTQEATKVLQEAAPGLMNTVLQVAGEGGDPITKLMPELDSLADTHGWYTAASVLSATFGHWYRPEAVPDVPSATENFLELLRMLPQCARSASADSMAWTVPTTILADAGRQEALELTACAAMCASVGYVESSLAKQVKGEAP